jgi:alpha-ketoglutarate-dependent taurine dioxygenase
LLNIASILGTPQPNRNKSLVDRLIPQEKDQAHPKSLSALTGLGIQPWHVDLAHYQTPARYIILACERKGSNPVATELVCWTSLIDAADQEAALAEPFLVCNGCHSFYATILTHSRQYVRFDPGCMQPVTKGAKMLMRKLSSKNINPNLRIDWKSDRAIIIDNWRILHRRLDAHGTQGRVLLRVSVTGES